MASDKLKASLKYVDGRAGSWVRGTCF